MPQILMLCRRCNTYIPRRYFDGEGYIYITIYFLKNFDQNN